MFIFKTKGAGLQAMSRENRNKLSQSLSIDDHDVMVIATINTLEQRLLHLEELSRKSVHQAMEEIETREQQQRDAYLATITQLEKEIIDRKRKEEYWQKRYMDIESKLGSNNKLNNKCDIVPSPPTTLHLPESLDKPSSTLTSTKSEQDELNEVKHRNQISEHDNTEKSFKAALLALQAKIECMEVIQQNEDKERKSTNHLQEICCFDQQSSNMQNKMKKDKLI